MRAVVQRVAVANVAVDGKEVGRCGPGLLLLVAVAREDDESDAARLAAKIVRLRIFNDEAGKMNDSLLDAPDERDLLVVSNFTVLGDASRGNRPSFAASADYETGRALFDRFVAEIRALGTRVQTGVFGAEMRVSLVNDGPVTLVVESRRSVKSPDDPARTL